MTAQNERIIGYSGFDVFEECYGYNENACYMVDSEAWDVRENPTSK